MILVAVTLTVAAIPEGLPLCVTISLSEGCASMVDENVLMRKIAAVETLGSAQIICTDKTGTLTEGKMTLVKMYAGQQDIIGKGHKGFDANKGTLGGRLASQRLQVRPGHPGFRGPLLQHHAQRRTAGPHRGRPQPAKMGPPRQLLRGPARCRGVQDRIKDQLGDDKEGRLQRVYEIPFSSSRKMMVTVTKTIGDSRWPMSPLKEATPHMSRYLASPGMRALPSPLTTVVRTGAHRIISSTSDSYMTADGSISPLTEEVKKEYTDKLHELSSEALRVLAIAHRDLGSDWVNDEEKDADTKFAEITTGSPCGLCASIDPERVGVKEAVRESREAGTRVVMITGDYLPTAVAIACNINILLRHHYEQRDFYKKPMTCDAFFQQKKEAMDCGDLRPAAGDYEWGHHAGGYLPHVQMDKLTSSINVFARAKPEDKLEIVKSLQPGTRLRHDRRWRQRRPGARPCRHRRGYGAEGTEVAKGASDMILTDDNLLDRLCDPPGPHHLCRDPEVRPFIMSVHFAEVVQIFLCIVANIPVMRQPLQILFLIL